MKIYSQIRITTVIVFASLLITMLPQFGNSVHSVASAAESISSTTQSSSLVELLQQINQANGCDESGNGNNNATCTNVGNNAVGPITQANSGYVGNNDGDVNYENAVDVSQRTNQANTCSESGSGSFDISIGDAGPDEVLQIFPAACTNSASNVVGPITQTNQGFTDNNDGDVNYENAVDIDQEVNQLNDCDESDSFRNSVACRNSGFNSVGSITQANSGYVGNNDGDVNYENAVDISQRINQANGCDESVDGNTVEGDPNVATCENTAPNTIGPITQTNQGFTDNNDGDVNYENAVDIDQEVNQLNDCDEEDGGFNQAICTNTSSISLGSITQANSGYTGNNDGDVNYENAVDVSQRTNQANTCSEFGFGDYGVGAPPQLVGICTNIGNNAVGSITQANSGYTGNNDGDVNYKNAVDIDQEVNQLNACDEFGGGNLANACRNSGSNSVGNIAQTNSGYAGNNDGDVNYKNAVDISQRINQANNCDESGGFPVGARSNNAICENTASNSVGSITQVNTGYPNNNGGDTSYQNAVDIDQEINQANRCSEADDGGNDAVCTNTATNTIGSIAQANQGYAGNNHGDTSYKNAVDLDQQVTQTNDCDENGAGGNNARCNNQASNSVGDISQSNDGDGKNDIDIDQKTSQKNDCDENGAGDNNARCSNKASNSVGDMSQSNDDDEEESEETNTSEENDDNNDNDDNDKEDQKESGENDKEDDDEKDIDVDQDVSQENDCTGNCSNDGTNSADSD